MSILSALTAALHVVDLILYFLCLHCGYLGGLVFFKEHLYLENLSYSKKQQEQAEAQTKHYHQSINSGSLFSLSGSREISLCVPATPCSTISTSTLTTFLKGGRKPYGHQGHCTENSALSGTSKAGTEVQTW